jgi:hypothetical protein
MNANIPFLYNIKDYLYSICFVLLSKIPKRLQKSVASLYTLFWLLQGNKIPSPLHVFEKKAP